jgi:tetratricopeptide (TPR) repeat protein
MSVISSRLLTLLVISALSIGPGYSAKLSDRNSDNPVSSIMEPDQLTEQRRTRILDRTQMRYSKWLKKASPETRRMFINAVELKSLKHDDQKALLLLKKIIILDRGFEPAYVQIGALFVRANRIDDALSYCTKALSLDQSDLMALRNRMYCNMMLKRYQAGINDATALLKIRPYDSDVLTDRSNAYKRIGNRQAAQRDLAAAKERSKLTVSNNGIMSLSESQQMEKLQLLSNQLQAEPDNALLLERHAAVLTALGMYSDAIDDINRAMRSKLTPIHQAYLFLDRARCYTALNQQDNALKDSQQAINRYEHRAASPGNWERSGIEEGYLLRADLCLSVHKPDEALANCGAYIRQFPQRTSGYLKRADMLVALNKTGAALSDYESAAKLNADDEHAWLAIAQLCENNLKLERSATAYSKLIQMHPDVGDFYLARARVLRKQGKLKEALTDYDAMVKRASDDPVGYEERAGVETTLGQFSKARSDLDQAIKASPEDATRLRKERDKLPNR